MAKFGEGVNAQLGATNYNAYLQGALQGAQGVARGGELMGQGIANVGSSIAGGIKEYQQNKKNNQALEGSVKSTLKLFESVDNLEGVSPEIKAQALSASKQLTDPDTPLAVRAAFAQQSRSDLGELMKLGQGAREEKVKNETYELYSTLARTRGQVDSDFVNKFSPEAQANASKLFYASENLKRQNEKLRAEATALGKPSVKDPSAYSASYNAGVQEFTERMNRLPNGKELQTIAAKAKVDSSTPVFLSADDQLKLDARKLEQADTINRSSKFLNDVSDNAIEASNQANDISQTRKLLASETTQTGWGQETLTTVRSFASRIGMENADLADQQALESYVSTDALRQTRLLMSKQGSITEGERARVDKTSMGIGKEKGTLNKLLDLREALTNRSIGAELERQRLYDEGKSVSDTAEGVRRWYQKNSITSILNGIVMSPGSSFKFPSGATVRRID